METESKDVKMNNDDTADTIPDSPDKKESTPSKKKKVTFCEPEKDVIMEDCSQDKKQDFEKSKDKIKEDIKTEKKEEIKDKKEAEKKENTINKTDDDKENASTISVKPEVKEEYIDYSEFPEDTVTQLTKNGIKTFIDNEKNWKICEPKRELVLQISAVKNVSSNGTSKIKKKLTLTDGISEILAFVVKGSNPEGVLVSFNSSNFIHKQDDEFKQRMIVRLKRPVTTSINEKPVFILKYLPVIIYKYVDQKIGNPKSYNERMDKSDWPSYIPIPYINKDVIKTHIKGGIK